MKKLVTNGFYMLLATILFLGITTRVNAQYTLTNLETTGLYAGMAKDASSNLYVVRVSANTNGQTYEIAKYPNGSTTPTVIYTGLTHTYTEFPWGIAVTKTGNVFVTNVTAAGTSSVIELTPNGTHYNAAITYLSGAYYTALAVDANDNLYTIQYNGTSKFNVVEYAAGSPAGSTGTILYANLNSGAGYTYPTGLALAPNGDVYVADAFSNTPSITDGGHVYKLTRASSYAVSNVSTGMYSTALATDASGNLYSNENSGSGYNLVEYAGGSGTGTTFFTGLHLHTNTFYYPWGIVYVSTNKIFVVDGDDGTNGGAVIRLALAAPTATTGAVTLATPTTATLNGTVNDNGNTTTVTFTYGTSSTLAGATTTPATTGGTINAGSGNTPVALTVSGLTASTKYFYRVNATNAGGTTSGSILNFTTPPSLSYTGPNTYIVGTTITPLTPTASAVGTPAYAPLVNIGSGFGLPFGMTADAAGNVYVGDISNKAIYKIPAGNGPVVTVASGLTDPIGLAVDANGNLYYNDGQLGETFEIPGGSGTPVMVASGLNGPYGVTVDAAGNLYVAEYGGGDVKRIPAGGGTPVAYGSGFTSPVGVFIDTFGNLFVADYGASAVTKIPAGGGAPVTIGSGFNGPTGVSTDGAGNVYVADYSNGALKIVRPGGTIVTVATGFSQNSSVATDAKGNLYMADYGHGKIDQFTPIGGYFITPAPPAGLTFSFQTGILTGKPTASAAAANYLVTAYDAGGGTSVNTNIKVVSTNANLTALALSAGTLAPVFASGTTTYTASVPNATTSITVTPTTSDPLATVTVNGVAVTSGSPSGPIALNVGTNTITTIVTATNGTTTNTYTVTVTRAGSNNDFLNSLALHPATTLTPTTGPGYKNYAATVPNSQTSTTVTAVTTDPNATLTINGVTTASGATSAPISLAVGQNTITIIVTAQNGTTSNTYDVFVTRQSNVATLGALAISTGTLSPTFAIATNSYTASEVNGTTSITVTPTTTDPNATVTVNGDAAVSGSPSEPITLSPGANTITVTVIAQDDVTTDSYTITVNRALSGNDNLSALTVSGAAISPAFAAHTTSYTASVANAVTSVTVMPATSDPGATVTVNGMAVTSGTASGPVTLNVGPNTITTAVTSQNGANTQNYTVVVTRAPSNNAFLGNLSLNSATISPAFASHTFSYSASVQTSTTSVTVKPVTSVTTSTVTVDGAAVASGTFSGAIPLVIGSNTITVVVTAQDGTTTETYTINVNRPAAGGNEFVALPQNEAPNNAGNDGIVVHQGISPNGDGIEDFLKIDGITLYPDNKVMIMNRDGAIVFEMKGYDNSAKVFDGHSNKTGAMQLPGTYFYSLDYKSGALTKHKTGFIILKY